LALGSDRAIRVRNAAGSTDWQWNSYEITVAGRTVTVTLNGVVVNRYTTTDPNRLFDNGFVGLQGSSVFSGGEDGGVQFRNVELRVNTPAARYGTVTGIGGKCLDIAGAGYADGTALQLYTCNDIRGGLAQNMTLPGDGTIHVMGKCLDAAGPVVPGAPTDNYAYLWTCNGTAPQQWWHLPALPPTAAVPLPSNAPLR
jgi:hypothetical protein